MYGGILDSGGPTAVCFEPTPLSESERNMPVIDGRLRLCQLK